MCVLLLGTKLISASPAEFLLKEPDLFLHRLLRRWWSGFDRRFRRPRMLLCLRLWLLARRAFRPFRSWLPRFQRAFSLHRNCAFRRDWLGQRWLHFLIRFGLPPQSRPA